MGWASFVSQTVRPRRILDLPEDVRVQLRALRLGKDEADNAGVMVHDDVVPGAGLEVYGVLGAGVERPETAFDAIAAGGEVEGGRQPARLRDLDRLRVEAKHAVDGDVAPSRGARPRWWTESEMRADPVTMVRRTTSPGRMATRSRTSAAPCANNDVIRARRQDE